jgi:hypothetical protein
LFTQMDSALMLLGKDLNLNWLGVKWLPAQVGAANPLIVMGLIPLFAFGVYPMMNKAFRLTPLRKISIGLFIAALAFVVPALIEIRISEIRHDNQPIGEVVFNGKSMTDLRIDFDTPAANGAAAKALMNSIQFDNSAEDPNTIVRTARITLVDASGAVYENDVTITILPKVELIDTEIDTEVDSGIVKFTTQGDPVDIASVDFDLPDDANFNGGYLLIHRQKNFNSKDRFSININSGVDADINTGIGRDKPSIAWLVLAVLILTIAEVMVSITVLEFSYTQAPKEMKSLIMAVSSLAVFGGNIFASQVNHFIYNPNGPSKLEGASYFWFFAGAMLLTAVIFIPFAARYKEHTFIQEEAPESDIL